MTLKSKLITLCILKKYPTDLPFTGAPKKNPKLILYNAFKIFINFNIFTNLTYRHLKLSKDLNTNFVQKKYEAQ